MANGTDGNAVLIGGGKKMAMQNPYNQYKENNIKTASPENLTLLLYNGAIKFIYQGKKFIEEKDIENAHNTILRAQAIIQELNITLNMDYEISHNLRSLYTYMLDRLVDANIGKNTEILDEVAEMVSDLRDTWKEGIKITRTRK